MKNKLIEVNPLFQGMPSSEIEMIEKCSHLRDMICGTYLARCGDKANSFYLIEKGRLAIEVSTPQGPVTVQTMTSNDVVGWSWLIEPHCWAFDLRVLESGSLLEFDGQQLRTLCERDPRMGYDFMKRFSKILASRLEATRLRLLDIYGVKK